MSWVVALSAVDSIQKIPLDVTQDFKDEDVPDTIKRVVREITKQVKLMEGD